MYKICSMTIPTSSSAGKTPIASGVDLTVTGMHSKVVTGAVSYRSFIAIEKVFKQEPARV